MRQLHRQVLAVVQRVGGAVDRRHGGGGRPGLGGGGDRGGGGRGAVGREQLLGGVTDARQQVVLRWV